MDSLSGIHGSATQGEPADVQAAALPLARRFNWFGMDAVELQAGGVRARILPSFGCNLISVEHPKFGEFLHGPAVPEAIRRSPFHLGTPVLFPPGRVAGGRFRFGGNVYHWPRNEGGRHHLHGFVYDQVWSVKAMGQTDDAAWMEAHLDAHVAHPAGRTFGHPFTLRLRYALRADGLACECTVENRDTRPMPLALGFHPYFRSGPDLMVTLPVREEWDLSGLIPTGYHADSPLCEQLRAGCPAHRLALDHVFTARPDAGGNVLCRFEDSAAGWVLDICWAASDFPFLVAFTGRTQAPFFSVEPYSWVPNAPNLGLPPENVGFAKLDPGETRRYAWSIAWQDLRMRR